jgi:hypothetical protein
LWQFVVIAAIIFVVWFVDTAQNIHGDYPDPKDVAYMFIPPPQPRDTSSDLLPGSSSEKKFKPPTKEDLDRIANQNNAPDGPSIIPNPNEGPSIIPQNQNTFSWDKYHAPPLTLAPPSAEDSSITTDTSTPKHQTNNNASNILRRSSSSTTISSTSPKQYKVIILSNGNIVLIPI